MMILNGKTSFVILLLLIIAALTAFFITQNKNHDRQGSVFVWEERI